MSVQENNMTSAETVSSTAAPEAEADDWVRSRVYGLLARVFADIPDQAVVELLASVDVEDEDGPLAEAWRNLSEAAAAADPESLDIEFHALFIGLGRGELMPFGSWYQSGFIMGRPLVKLREDLREFGLERESGVHEPEDHVAALLESMALLSGPEGTTLAAQRVFFNDHLAGWVERFMQDLQQAKSANFYRAVGAFAERFMVTEKQYLEMV
ncbi:TorD/DmsD family molecular chaperone [Spiribacter pallidus]|uniref:TorD/DmsD family molecular chaperone n=1 Tax=Spiribacter pallidus TaxID=1987936 RepID=UPI00349FAF00